MRAGQLGLVLFLGGLGSTLPARAQQDLGTPAATSCPLDAGAKGTIVRRTFTSKAGRTTSFSLKLPADFDPAVKRGIVLYLHGNDNDQGGAFYPELERVPENTEQYGLVPAVAMSPETRTEPDGSSRNVQPSWVEIAAPEGP